LTGGGGLPFGEGWNGERNAYSTMLGSNDSDNGAISRSAFRIDTGKSQADNKGKIVLIKAEPKPKPTPAQPGPQKRMLARSDFPTDSPIDDEISRSDVPTDAPIDAGNNNNNNNNQEERPPEDDRGRLLIGCGTLQNEVSNKVLVAKMKKYPGYDGELDPSGTVTVTYQANQEDVFVVSYKLRGVLPDCANCGMHIHSGTSCDDAGGHGWHTPAVNELWSAEGGAMYETSRVNRKGFATGYFNTYNGFGYEENKGHAVVIHTENGDRVGCGVLEAKK